MTDIKRAELEIVLEMLTAREQGHNEAARDAKGYERQRHFGEAEAYREAAMMIRDTLQGTSWVGIRQLLEINRQRFISQTTEKSE